MKTFNRFFIRITAAILLTIVLLSVFAVAIPALFNSPSMINQIIAIGLVFILVWIEVTGLNLLLRTLFPKKAAPDQKQIDQ